MDIYISGLTTTYTLFGDEKEAGHVMCLTMEFKLTGL